MLISSLLPLFILILIALVIWAISASTRTPDSDDTPSQQGESGDCVKRTENDPMEREARKVEELLSAPLERIESPFPLKSGEACYVNEHAALFEYRKVRTGTAFAGPTISIPIAKSLGLRFRAGYFAHPQTSEDRLTPIDEGTIAITNNAVVFLGSKVSKTIKLRDIVQPFIDESPNPDVVPYLVGIRQLKGRIPFFALRDPSRSMAALIRLTRTSITD